MYSFVDNPEVKFYCIRPTEDEDALRPDVHILPCREDAIADFLKTRDGELVWIDGWEYPQVKAVDMLLSSDKYISYFDVDAGKAVVRKYEAGDERKHFIKFIDAADLDITVRITPNCDDTRKLHPCIVFGAKSVYKALKAANGKARAYVRENPDIETCTIRVEIESAEAERVYTWVRRPKWFEEHGWVSPVRWIVPHIMAD